MRLFFLGDVVDESGCRYLQQKLPAFKRAEGVDVCLANGENSAPGNGATPDSCEMLFAAGVDFITLGNHAFRRPELGPWLESATCVIRPYNYPDGAPGRGCAVLDTGRYRVGVVNLLGTAFLQPLGNPFEYADRALAELADCRYIVVDIHAEATGEKKALACYLDGRVSAVLGTHTHVATADEQVLPGGTAYQTDVGMTGAVNSVLGVRPDLVIQKMKTALPVRFAVGEGPLQADGCLIEIDPATGRATAIERVTL